MRSISTVCEVELAWEIKHILTLKTNSKKKQYHKECRYI